MVIFLCLFSCLCHWAALRKVCLHLRYSPHQIFIHMDQISLSLQSLRMISPSSVKLSLYDRCSEPSLILTPFWTLSSGSISLLYCTLLCHRGTFLEFFLLVAHQKNQFIFYKDAFQPVSTHLVLVILPAWDCSSLGAGLCISLL